FARGTAPVDAQHRWPMRIVRGEDHLHAVGPIARDRPDQPPRMRVTRDRIDIERGIQLVTFAQPAPQYRITRLANGARCRFRAASTVAATAACCGTCII